MKGWLKRSTSIVLVFAIVGTTFFNNWMPQWIISNVNAVEGSGDSSGKEDLTDRPKSEDSGELTEEASGDNVTTNKNEKASDSVNVTDAESGSNADSTAKVKATEAEDFKYSVLGGKATVTSYTGTETDIVIPEQLGGYDVVSLAPRAFGTYPDIVSITFPSTLTSLPSTYGNSVLSSILTLKKVVFQDSPATIGDYAFSSCNNLEEIDFGDQLKSIGNYAFAGAKVKTLTIPSSVTSIGEYAFNSNLLTTVKIGDDFDTTTGGQCVISKRAFDKCNAIEEIYFGNSVQSIGDYALTSKNLTEVYFGKNVKTIGSYLCSGSKLTEVIIPDSVITIGESTFYSCLELKKINCGKNVESIGNSAFRECTNVTEIVLGDSLKNIGPSAFLQTGIVELIIPNSVKDIGSSAFSQCKSLKILKIGDSVNTIGYNAFSGSALQTVAIPDSVVSIDVGAFQSSGELKSIAIGKGVTSIGANAFNKCTNLEQIKVDEENANFTTIDGVLFNKDVTTLIRYPQNGEKVNYVIPDTVSTIVDGAFSDAINLKSVTLPDGITSIDNAVFVGCLQLESILVGDGNTAFSSVDGVLYSKDKATLLRYPQYRSDKSYLLPETVTKIGQGAFDGATNLEEITLPDSMKNIDASAFLNARTICKVNMPEDVVSIGNNAFAGCSSLSSINLPDSIQSIGSSAFFECISLKSISIPEGMKLISENTFFGCTSLEEVDMGTGIESIGNGAFASCTALQEFVFPSSLTKMQDGAGIFSGCVNLSRITFDDCAVSIGFQAFAGLSGLTYVDLGSKVTEVSGGAFQSCKALKEVKLSKDLLIIAEAAFSECTSLETIIFPENLKTIQYNAFSKCTNLKEIVFDNSPTEIMMYAFRDCVNISSVSFGNGITSIGESAFTNTKITELSFPESLKSIERYAFYRSGELTTIKFNNSPGVINDYAFSECSKLEEVSFGDDLEFIGMYAFRDCASLKKVDFENSPVSIFDYAFQDCLNIEEINLGSQVKIIGGYAFYQCKVKELTFPESVTFVGQYTFGECENLESIKFDDSPAAIYDNAFQDCSKLSSVSFGNQLKTIGNRSFYGTDIDELEFPESLIYIGNGAFALLDNLKSVVFNNSPAEIRDVAFANCKTLSSISFGNSVKTIGQGAFTGSQVEELSFPASLILISTGAFEGCEKLTGISFDNSVADIGGQAFKSCINLENVSWGSNIKSIGEGAFEKCGFSAVTIPDSVKEIGKSAFTSNEQLREVNFSGDAIKIGVLAFSHNKQLEKVEFNNSAAEIGESAFYNCTSLLSISFEGVKTIGNSAFRSCGLETVIIPSDVEKIGNTAFESNENLRSVKFNDCTVEIGGGAFSNNKELLEVTFDNGVAKIGKSAFENNEKLSKVEFNNNTAEIGDYAFNNSTALLNISLGEAVKSIGEYAFRSSGLETVTIPSSVEKIGALSFTYNNQLQEVIFDGCTVEIGDFAFQSSSKLQKVTFDDSSAAIGESAFSYCTSLSAVSFGDKTKSISKNAFMKCALESLTIPSNIEQIGETAFSGNANLRKVTFDNSGVDIGLGAFTDNIQLSEVEFSGSPAKIGAGAFTKNPKLSLVTFENSAVEIGSSAFANNEMLHEVKFSGSPAKIGGGAFRNSKELRVVTFIDSAVEIGQLSFADCNVLSSVYFGEGIQSIGKEAFMANGLESVTIPAQLVKIGESAFANSENLREVTFEDGAADIGASAFANCSTLAAISFGTELKTIGKEAFMSCAFETLFIPDSVTSIGERAFYGNRLLITVTIGRQGIATGADAFENCPILGEINYDERPDENGVVFNTAKTVLRRFPKDSEIEIYTVPDGVTTIDINAFKDAGNLKSITLPRSVKKINAGAFGKCISLVEVDLGDGIEIIGRSAFAGCSALKSIEFPSSLQKIENGSSVMHDGAFVGCKSLKKIVFNQSAAEIGDYAFSKLTILEEVDFGDNIKGIGNYAFDSDMSLSSPILPNSLKSIGKNAFGGCISITELVIPGSVDEIGQNSFSKCSNLTNITLMEGVTNIGEGAFDGCGLLDTLVLPEGVMSIGANAFSYCVKLSQCAFPNSLEQIGANAFAGCSKLSQIDFGKGVKTIEATAFRATAIVDAVIPDSVTSLDRTAFQQCVLLKSITIGKGITDIDNSWLTSFPVLESVNISEEHEKYASHDGVLFSKDMKRIIFYSVNNLEENYNVPDTVTSIDPGVFRNAKRIKSIKLPDGLKTIGVGTFEGCTSLSEISFGKGVETIENSAFKGCSALREIVFPNSLTSIKDARNLSMSAFSGCTSLNKVVFQGDLEKIGDYAFYNCTALSEIEFSENLTHIGISAFAGCKSLENVEFPQKLNLIDRSAFMDCTKLLSASFGEAPLTIGVNAFQSCAFTELYIPESVTRIMTRAFQSNLSLTSVSIASRDTVLDAEVFFECPQLEGIDYEGEEGDQGILFNEDKTVLIQFPINSSITDYTVPDGVITIEANAFKNAINLNTVTFPNSIEVIRTGVFEGCTNLEKVKFQDCPAEIGNYAFNNLPKLNEVDLGGRVKKIGNNSFYGCANLSKVTLSAGLTAIGSNSFMNCTALKEIAFPAKLVNVGVTAFSGCTALTRVEFYDSAAVISNGAFYNCNLLSEVLLGNNIISIGSSAFRATGLTEMTVPDSVTIIDSLAFDMCKSLSEITIGKGTRTMDTIMFANCGKLEAINVSEDNEWFSSVDGVLYNKDKTILYRYPIQNKQDSFVVPEGVVTIGGSGFKGVAQLREVYLPDSLRTVEDSAFDGCILLTKAVLGNGIETLQTSAFRNCTSLRTMVFPASLITIASGTSSTGTFTGCIGLEKVVFSNSSTTIGNYAFYALKNLKEVDLGQSVKRIGSNSFANCTALSEIRLCEGLNDIDTYAFYGCVQMRNVVIGDGTRGIGDRAFGMCNALERIEIPKSVVSIGNNTFVSSPNVRLHVWKNSYSDQYSKIHALSVQYFSDNTAEFEVTLPAEYNLAQYGSTKLRVFNETQNTEVTVSATGEKVYVIEGQRVNDTYRIELINRNGLILSQIAGIVAIDGINQVKLVKLAELCSIDLTVLSDTGADVTGQATIQWYDSDGVYLKQGNVLGDMISGEKVEYTVALNQALGQKYVQPQRQSYTVGESNSIKLNLKLISSVDITGRVVDAQTGKLVQDAFVLVSQKLNGKYPHTVSVTTDDKGVFSAEVFDCPTEIIVSAQDKIKETIVKADWKSGADVGDIKIKPLTGAIVSLNLDYVYNMPSRETPVHGAYPDINDLQFTVTNLTQKKELDDFVCQDNKLILPSNAKAGDELNIKVTSQSGVCKDTQVTVKLNELGAVNANFTLVQYGSIAILLEEVSGRENMALVYNDDGKLVNSYEYIDGAVKTDLLPDGAYSIISMEKAQYFKDILTINSLLKAQILPERDYVRNQVRVVSSKVTNLTVQKIPAFDESRFDYIDQDNTLFSSNNSAKVAGSYVTLQSKIAFLDKYKDKVSEVKLIVEMPENCSFVKDSVIYGENNTAGSYLEEGNTVTIPIKNMDDLVRFCIIAKQTGVYKPNGFVEFLFDKEIVRYPIGAAKFEATDLIVKMPTRTSMKRMTVAGMAKPNAEIAIYDGNILIGKTNSVSGGEWSMTIDLVNPHQYSKHDIHAEVTDTAGMKVKSSVRQVVYDGSIKDLVKVNLLYDGQDVLFDFQNPFLSSRSYVVPAFSFERKGTFTVDFTENDPKSISNVKLNITTNDGGEYVLKTAYDESIKKWVAVGNFQSISKLPVNVSVQYNTKMGEHTVLNDEGLELVEQNSVQRSAASSVKKTLDLESYDDWLNVEYEGYKETAKLADAAMVDYYMLKTKQLYKLAKLKKYSLTFDASDLGHVSKSGSEGQGMVELYAYTNAIQGAKNFVAVASMNKTFFEEYFDQARLALKMMGATSISADKTNSGSSSGSGSDFNSIAFKCSVGNDIQIRRLEAKHDPSGYVYEAVASNRIQDVTTTCFFEDTVTDMWGETHKEARFWNAEDFGQVNPLITNNEGRYAWDVPEGLWQVKYEKEGYETAYSDWLPVPPPQLEVNIGIVSYEQPKLKQVVGYETGIVATFDRYMKVDSLTAQNITASVGGKPISGKVVLLNEEANPKNKTEKFASKIRFVPDKELMLGTKAEIQIGTGAKTYSNVSAAQALKESVTIVQEPKEIVAEAQFNVASHVKADLNVQVKPASAAAGKKLIVMSSMPTVAAVPTEIVIDKNGKAVIPVSAGISGGAKIKLVLKDSDLEKDVAVNVAMPGELKLKAPAASSKSGTALRVGSTVKLTTNVTGAKIYYTLDGSSPQSSKTRRVYSKPILITKKVTLRTVAYKNGYESSGIATYSYKILTLSKPVLSLRPSRFDRIQLSWKAVRGAQSYDVYRASKRTGKYVKIKTVKVTKFQDTRCRTGTIYYYIIRAKYTVGGKNTYSSYSSIKSLRAVPIAPTVIGARKMNRTSAKVTFKKVFGAKAYEVYMSTGLKGRYKRLGATRSQSYTIKKLKARKYYYFKVRAYRMVGKRKVYSSCSKVIRVRI